MIAEDKGSSNGHTFSWLEREMTSLLLSQIAGWIRHAAQRIWNSLRPRSSGSQIMGIAVDVSRSRRELVIENAVLRHQINILRRGKKRPRLGVTDGGTAALKFRDGTISTSAWAQVSQHAHVHGAYTPVKVGNAWYSPGLSASEGSIWKTTDEGATWINLVPGYYWPSPPNPAFMNKRVTGLAATATYLYSNTGSLPELARAPIAKLVERTRVTEAIGLEHSRNKPHFALTKSHPQMWLITDLTFTYTPQPGQAIPYTQPLAARNLAGRRRMLFSQAMPCILPGTMPSPQKL
jgi:hypothetical protein